MNLSSEVQQPAEDTRPGGFPRRGEFVLRPARFDPMKADDNNTLGEVSTVDH